VFFIARTSGAIPTFTLILAGVTLNFIFFAVMMFIHYAANFNQSYLMTRWTMGALDSADMRTVLGAAPFVIGCLIGLMWIAAQLNPLSAAGVLGATRGAGGWAGGTCFYFISSLFATASTL